MIWRMERQGVSSLVAALVTALAWTAPLPIRWMVVEIDPLSAGLLAVPIILAVVVAVLVWRYGWERRAVWGAFLGVLAVAGLSELSAVLDGHGGAGAVSFVGALLFVAVMTLLAWEVGGWVGRRFRPERTPHLETAATP